MSWVSAGLLMEEETPFGMFDRSELESEVYRRIPFSETHVRNARMRELHDAGTNVQALAKRFDLSERTVLRIVAGWPSG